MESIYTILGAVGRGSFRKVERKSMRGVAGTERISVEATPEPGGELKDGEFGAHPSRKSSLQDYPDRR
jgi:hypothetical protein